MGSAEGGGEPQEARGLFPGSYEVFGDPLALTYDDPDHEEERFLTFGYSSSDRVLVLAHTYRSDRIRIIPARRLTPKERREYEQLRK